MGGGKSVFLVNEGIQLSLDYPGNVGLLCRWELESLRRTTLMTLEDYLPDQLIANHHKTEKYYQLINGSIIFYGGLKPSSEAVSTERLKSMELGWFAIDESTEIQKKYFDILKTRLRHKVNGRTIRYKGLLASNPEPGWVRSDFIDNKSPDQIFIPALPTDNPYLPEGYVDSLKRNLPSELVKKYLEGDWDVLEGENYLFPYSLVKVAMERDLPTGEPVQAGLDVARMGGDEIILAIRYGPVVDIKYSRKFQDTMQTAGEVGLLIDKEERQLKEWSGENLKIPIYVDIPGLGGGVYDRLKEQGYDVYEFQPGGKASNNLYNDRVERFLNKKAEASWNLRNLLEAGEVSLPNDPILMSQLVSIRYEIRSDRKIKVESKEDAKKRGLKSPDRADAVIMAFADLEKATAPHFGFFSMNEEKKPDIWGER
jgi:hypothetical protein